MAKNRIICRKKDIDYISIRQAMTTGARTLEELKEKPGVCGECEGCEAELDGILSSVCGCKEVSLQDVIDAVNNGANTVEKVGEITGAGTGVDEETGEKCGKCKKLVQNVIDLGY